MGKEAEIRGLALAKASAEEMHQTHVTVGTALCSGVLKPVLGGVFSLAHAAQAHTWVLQSGNCGKIVLLP